jgi:hypothetical protein
MNFAQDAGGACRLPHTTLAVLAQIIGDDIQNRGMIPNWLLDIFSLWANR